MAGSWLGSLLLFALTLLTLPLALGLFSREMEQPDDDTAPLAPPA